MDKIKFLFAILSCKLISSFISKFKLGQGGNLAGKIALKIDKNLIDKIKFKNNTKIIFITGTNGKSTTCGLVVNILKTAGYSVHYNKSGANLLSGIANTLCFYCDISGNYNFDFLVLEVDEATLQHLTKYISPNIIAITNLYRDQLDRFGELDTTLKLIGSGINNCKDVTLVLNADDKKLLKLQGNQKKIFYGIENDIKNQDDVENNYNWFSDPIEFSECKNGFTPTLNFKAYGLQTDSLSSNFYVQSDSFNKKQNFFIPLIGKFNFYNALCALAIVKTITDVTPVQVQKAFSSYDTLFGRAEKIKIKNKDAWIYLIKNPAGTTEVLKTLSNIKNARFLIALNDNFADGRDVSWIWDANFDILANHKKNIFVSGKRVYDMALRLKYAGVESIIAEEDIRKAVDMAVSDLIEDEILYILPTYTVLLEMQKIKISKMVPL